MGELKVSVVLPAYNEEATLKATLESILDQDFKGEYEIVVCDNNSKDRTAEIAESMGARVVHEPKKGTRFAYDTGMRESKGELILVTNADVSVPQNWISSIVARYEDPEVVGVGTKVRYKNSPRYVNAFLRMTEFFNFHRAMWGTSLSCRRWAYEKVGGFNHGVNTNEDGIFTLLLEKIGKVVYEDGTIVLMDGRRFSGGLVSALKEWAGSYGLNSIYIQLNYTFTGKIRTLVKDFGDVRSSVFGHGEETAISVIIPTNNDQESIAHVLSSLQDQEFSQRFKIYVLDNFSTDLSLDIAANFPNVNIITYPKIFNFGERLHKLLLTIDSPVIAFTSPRAILPPDWLDRIYSEFSKKRERPIDVLSGPFNSLFTRAFSTFMNQPLDKLSNKFEFDNFATSTALMRNVVPRKGTLAEVSEELSEKFMSDVFNVYYAMTFRSEYSDKNLFKGMAADTSESLKHTLKKLMRPMGF